MLPRALEPTFPATAFIKTYGNCSAPIQRYCVNLPATTRQGVAILPEEAVSVLQQNRHCAVVEIRHGKTEPATPIKVGNGKGHGANADGDR
jgi:hypothetical protein